MNKFEEITEELVKLHMQLSEPLRMMRYISTRHRDLSVDAEDLLVLLREMVVLAEKAVSSY